MSLPLFSFVKRLFTNLKGSLKKLDLACSFLLRLLLRFSALLKVDSLFLISACSRFIPSFSSSGAFLHCFFSCLLSLTSCSISCCLLDFVGMVDVFFLFSVIPKHHSCRSALPSSQAF